MLSEFLTLEAILTFSGLLAVVGVFTEMFKRIGFLVSVPTQLTSYVIALLTLVLGNIALGTFSFPNLLLMVINAGVVSLAANGGYDIVSSVVEAGHRNKMERIVEDMVELEEEVHNPDVDNG